jgi:hypothetical protein
MKFQDENLREKIPKESVMRQTITGFFAAIALMFAGAAPATACGYASPCAPIYAPSYSYGYAGCGTCGGGGWYGGWGYDRLTDPTTQYQSVERAPQYYYANQGPTFTGPGAFAPYPTYARQPHYYGYGTYRWRHHYSFRPHHGYRYGYHRAVRYGYHNGRPVLRRYY